MFVAALYVALPACDAWIVHVPAVMSVTVLLLTVQTDVVSEAKLTLKPDEAVALTVKGTSPYVRLIRVPKVIVWLVCAPVTLKLRSTLGAALYAKVPPCAARRVQLPVAVS